MSKKLNIKGVKWKMAINKNKILKDLCNAKKDDEIIKIIDDFEKNLIKIKIKKLFKILKITELHDVLLGNDIKKYCENSKNCGIFVITLGIEVDKKLRFYEKTDKLKYLVFDKVCSYYIEHEMDILQKEINKTLLVNSKFVKERFCTGYGDFPLKVNEVISDILDVNTIGVYLTDKHMFIPSKTICGIIASSDIDEKFDFCISCNTRKNCKQINNGRKCFEKY